MSAANLLTVAGIVVGGLGGGAAILQAVFSRGGARSVAAKTDTESEKLKRDTWKGEFEANYSILKQQYEDCRKDVKNMGERHSKELGTMRHELAEVRRALIVRADVVDDLLAYVQGLPDDKMRELRASNRAVKLAAYRVDSDL